MKKNLLIVLLLLVSVTAYGQDIKPFQRFCTYLKNGQFDSCLIELNNFIKQDYKHWRYSYMEETMGTLDDEFKKLNCGLVLWKQGRYVDEVSSTPLTVEEQDKRLRKSKPLLLVDFLLEINNSDTLFYEIRYSVKRKTETILIKRTDKIPEQWN